MLLIANTLELKAQTSPNIVPANGNAGFGTTTPTEKVEINGKIKVIDKATFKDDVTIENDLKIKSLEDLNNTTNRLLGVTPNGKIVAPNGLLINNNGYKLDINGILKVDAIKVNYLTVNDTAYIKNIVTNRIKSLNGDSLIYFGDSSVVMNHVKNQIFASMFPPALQLPGRVNYRGFNIGATNLAYATGSFTMGNNLQTKSTTYGNIIIGSGIMKDGSNDNDAKSISSPTTIPFINDKSNSLMVGFLSTQPTFYVGPNTDIKDNSGYGYVGIATKNPIARLDVNGGPLWTTDGWNKAIKIANGNAFEMQGYEVKWGMGTASDDNWYLFNTKTEEQTDAAHYVMAADYNGNVTVYGNLNVAGSITGSSSGWGLTGNTNGGSSFLGTTDWSPIIFKTYNTERMRIADDGRVTIEGVFTVDDYVSIGTHNVNTAYKLGVAGAINASEYYKNGVPLGGDNLGNHTATQDLKLSGFKLTNNGAGGIQIGSNGNVGINTVPSAAASEVFKVGGNAHIQQTLGVGTAPSSYLSIVANGNCQFSGSTGIGGAPDNTVSNKLKVHGNLNVTGNVIIANTTTPGNLTVNGNMVITGSGTIGGQAITSDKRYKKNINTIDNALLKLLQLKGFSYDFDTINYPQFNFNNGKSIGFIAQDVKEIFPMLVWENKEGYLAVNYDAIIPVIVEAIKEQQSIIEEQTKQIELLRNGNTELIKPVDLISNSLSVTENKQDDGIMLYQNKPNPFSENTSIQYKIPSNINEASIIIYDMQGKQLKKYDNLTKGDGSVIIYSQELYTGMFMYSLIVDGNEMSTKRMVLTK